MKISIVRNNLKATLNPLRLKPDTFIVGFQKSGTTSLYNYLVESKAYIPGEGKENDLLISDGLYLKKYLSRFPISINTHKRTLCASHQVAFNPIGIDRLKLHFPSAKFVFIMRDPVKRAYSRYLHNQRKVNAVIDKKFDGDFQTVVDFELSLLNEMTNIYDMGELYKVNSKFNLYGLPISRGIYFAYIKRFLDNEMDCYFLSLEDLSTNFSSELKKLYEFLNVKGPLAGSTVHNKASIKETTPSEAKAMEKLEEFYKEPNEKLYELIGKDFGW